MESWAFNILGNWNEDVDVVCNTALFVVALYFHDEPYFGIWWGFYNNINSKKRLNSNIQSVAH